MASTRVIEQWGTVISIDVRDPIDEQTLDACATWFQRVDDLFSTWRADTEIMRIARGELAVDRADLEVRTVLELCEQMRLESGGAFDVRFALHAPPCVSSRPGFAELDPSGVVKGWAVARAAALLRAAGATNFFVNAGGDIVTNGHPVPGARWRVGLQHPWERSRVAAVLEVSDAAVATSGRYERGNHIIDPRTGTPATDVAAVTVVGPDLALADAYATTALVLGVEAGLQWISDRIGYEALMVVDASKVLSTPGFARYRVS